MTKENRDFMQILAEKRKADLVKDEEYLKQSKQRLIKIATQKLRTTMIGALSAIEKHFGFCMGFNEFGQDGGKNLTPEEKHMKDIYDDLRSEILDVGNGQIRNLETELQQYEIKWERFQINLPIKPEGPTGGNNV